MRFFLEAFYELSSCRAFGMTLGPIPFTAIAEYSSIFYDGDFEDFLYAIRVMDKEYLRLSHEDQKAKMAKTNSGKK